MDGTMMDVPLTLTMLFERAVMLFPRREIVCRRSDYTVQRYTYADLARRSLALGETLAVAGLRPGDRVATLMWNDSAHLEAYFGIPLAGGVLHTLNVRLSPDQLAWIVNDAGSRYLIVGEDLLPSVEMWRARTPLERVFVVRGDDGEAASPLPAGYESYETLIAGAKGQFIPHEAQESDACGLCYTSGTEGRPKGVLYTHRSSVLHSLVVSLPDSLSISQHDHVLPVVPMFHANAWGLPYAAVMTGAKLVLPGRHLDPGSLLELFEQESVTFTAGVPSIWVGLLQALDREPGRWRLQAMRMAVGGAAAPESLIRGFDRHGHEVIHAWGMTETSPLGAVSRLKAELTPLRDEDRYRYRTSQGLPPPLLKCRVVAECGPVPCDGKSSGELQVRGPWVAGSYFGAAQDPERFTTDGWLRTGDVAVIDAEGYLRIVDRAKDMIKSGGEWISSCELELELLKHSAVKEACVVAVAHARWGERPLALVVFRDDCTASPEALNEHLAKSFPKWWLPEAFISVPMVPRTSVGKVDKRALREEYADWCPREDPAIQRLDP